MARERLEWVEPARKGLLSALEEDVMHPTIKVFPTVDPLKFILMVTLLRPVAKGTRQPLRTYLRCWAESHGCELPIIRIEKNCVKAEVLIQKRVWSRDEQGKFRGGKRFERGPGRSR